jgi:hypothetical protein
MSQTPDPVAEAIKGALNKDTIGAFRGTRTIQGASIHATMLAYQQVEVAAKHIAKKVQESKHTPILLQVGEDLSELAERKAFDTRTGKLTADIEEQIAKLRDVIGEKPVAGLAIPIPVVGAIASSVVSLLGVLFRTDVIETHAAVTIDDRVLVAAVARELKRLTIEALTPTEVALLEPPPEGLMKSAEVLEELSKELRRLAAVIAGMLPEKPTLPLSDETKKLIAATASADYAVRAFDTFWTSFIGAASRLYRADAMVKELTGTEKEPRNGRILALRILAGGGGARVEHRAWREDPAVHSGGVIVSYALLDHEGKSGPADSAVLPFFDSRRELNWESQSAWDLKNPE